ncbi:MAG: corrinoid protein [Anaerolineales bacterium]|nr:corrinoid protein [Anaerolineales bacterium]MCS7248781.1 corrinoid protein [Anaerolineales bacterium]MDW8162594.1 corrinoid protein [Anaerolineales bacterium]MDW8446030.1 corrinoid protein [Anaerolineales bacterium]
MEDALSKICRAVVEGDDVSVVEYVREALQAGESPLRILNEGLMPGADIVGKRFEEGEYFLPDLMLAGRALKAAMEILKPLLAAAAATDPTLKKARIVIATVQTDIHDIGKNIVASMLAAAGYEVIDMGVDVPLNAIIEKAEETKADIIALSALLTTSMPYMKDLIELLKARGLRQKYRVMVGGASVTPEWAESIGADGTGRDAVEAVRLARRLLGEG